MVEVGRLLPITQKIRKVALAAFRAALPRPPPAAMCLVVDIRCRFPGSFKDALGKRFLRAIQAAVERLAEIFDFNSK